jgi:hypothetical protein
MNEEMSAMPETAQPVREAKANRLPVGRLRELVAALNGYGRVFALVRRGRDISLAPLAAGRPLQLARRLPTVGPEEAVLPPADVLFGARLQPMDMGYDTGAIVLFAIPPCLIYSIRFLDRLLASGPFRDAGYATRRSRSLLVAMNCVKQRRECYCEGLGIGPALRRTSDADIVLTPVGSGFAVESGSTPGAQILSSIGIEAGAGA